MIPILYKLAISLYIIVIATQLCRGDWRKSQAGYGIGLDLSPLYYYTVYIMIRPVVLKGGCTCEWV